jgi:hypothetical protein
VRFRVLDRSKWPYALRSTRTMSRRSKVTSFPAVGESEARDSFAERNLIGR